MKINYQLKMEEQIKALNGRKPKLLLHCCCAPCSSAVLERIAAFFDITLFFYNPNISPESEFNYRLEELHRLLKEMGLEEVKIISPSYDYREFEEIAAGFEDAPERGSRCEKCYRLRLQKTAAQALKDGFEYFATTLTLSPHKNAEWLNAIGEELQKEYSVRYLFSDFKKCEGYKRSIELSNEYGLYRQDYCGCIFSKMQKMPNKIPKKQVKFNNVTY